MKKNSSCFGRGNGFNVTLKLLFLSIMVFSSSAFSQVGTTCENPIVINSLPYTTTDDTANYADNYDPSTDGSPECGTSNGNYYHGGNDVIYSFTPATNTSITITMPDVVAWTGMFLYTNCSDIGINYAACSVSSTSGDRIINEFPVTAGQTYYILLSTFPSPQTFAYTLSVVENTCISQDVDFDVVSACTGTQQQFFVTADVTDMGSATSVTVTDNQGSASQQLTAPGLVTFGPYDNNTEVILTAANSTDANCIVTSNVLTQIACPPANDDCTGAIALTVNADLNCGNVTSGTTLGATESAGPDVCNGNPDDDVWFSFTATAELHVISLTNIVTVFGDDDDDLYIEVLSGSCGSLVNVDCSDPEVMTVDGLTIGENYLVRVYSYYDDTRQTFDICVGTMPPPPANDDCAGAMALTVNTDLSCSSVTSGTTLGATESAGPDECGGNPDDDVWFSFTATTDMHIISLSNIVSVFGDEDDDDLYIEVLSGTCGSLTNFDCSDPETVEVTGLTVGETYLVRIYSYFSDTRQTFDICVGTMPPPPANDDCAGAIALTVNPDLSCSNVTSGTTLGATESVGPEECSGNPDDDVWFSFNATTDVHIISLSNIVSVYGDEDDDDMYIEVLSGTCGSLTNLDCSDPETMEVTGLTAGQTYLVRVYGYDGTTRQTFDICVGTVPPPPANDDCANATAIVAGNDFESAAMTATNTGATHNDTDPVPDCDAFNFEDNGKDVWFTITAPYSTVTFETRSNGDTFIEDTGLAVYSGTCGQLVELGCNADSGEGNFSLLTLDNLTAGETLYVRVWGYNGSFGSFDVAAYYECDLDAPAGDAAQTLAPGETLAELDVTGDNLTWYTDEALQNQVDETTVAQDGTTYYVTQTVGECVSEALAVTVSIVDPCAGIEAPAGDASQTLEPGETLADLEVTGDNLTWFTDEALQNQVDETTVAQDGTTYYVTQTVGECVSEALAVTVSIVDPCEGVEAPTGDALQQFTEGETLANLEVSGDNLTWYADEDLENELPDTTVLTDDTTYYVTQTVGECESDALAITVDETLSAGDFDVAGFRFWPNPAADVLNLSYSKQIEYVEVYNMLGQQVHIQNVDANDAAIDISKLAAGTYIVKVNAEEASKTIRIVKK